MTAQRFRAHLMPFALASFCALIILGCPAPENSIVYVNVNTPATKATQDGTSWSRAFATIQEGIDTAANAGLGEVWVAQGVYNEVRSADSDGSLVMRHGVNLYGGFLGFEASRALRNWDRNATVIDGTNARGERKNAIHVVKGANALLDGFSVTGGKSIWLDEESTYDCFGGGGMYNEAVSPTIAHCVFYGNGSDGQGAALHSIDSNVTISDCTFRDNFSDGQGGALSSESSSMIVTGCLFTDNIASSFGGAVVIRGNNGAGSLIANCHFNHNLGGYGGAIYEMEAISQISQCRFENNVAYTAGAIFSSSGGPAITHCVFDNNHSRNEGGAVELFPIRPSVISGCVFSNNAANSDGGALHIELVASRSRGMYPFAKVPSHIAAGGPFLQGSAFLIPPSVALTNCLLIGNTAYRAGAVFVDGPALNVTNCTIFENISIPGVGGGICVNSGATTISNSILWANYANGVPDDLSGPVSISYSCTQFGLSAGSSGNISENPQFVDPLGGDFSLKWNSPCVDSGTLTDAPAEDIRGQSRPQGGGIDMGAYEV